MNACVILKAVVTAEEWAAQASPQKASGALTVNRGARAAEELSAHGCEDANILASAVLRNALQAKHCSEEYLAERINPVVAAIVVDLTCDIDVFEDENSRINAAIQIANRAKSDEMCTEAKAVLLATAIAVLKSPPEEWTDSQVQEYAIWTHRMFIKERNDIVPPNKPRGPLSMALHRTLAGLTTPHVEARANQHEISVAEHNRKLAQSQGVILYAWAAFRNSVPGN